MRELISKQIIDEDVDSIVENLASKTEGWSGADLKQLIEDSKKRSLLDIIKGNSKNKLTAKDFEKVLAKQKTFYQTLVFLKLLELVKDMVKKICWKRF
jgi:SpoVK/Ycf46/Vps4 family AAA+-type ATPase